MQLLSYEHFPALSISTHCVDECMVENDAFDERAAQGGWDCDPFITADAAATDDYDYLDEEDDEGDYQVTALERFSDRSIWGGVEYRGDRLAGQFAESLADREPWRNGVSDLV